MPEASRDRSLGTLAKNMKPLIYALLAILGISTALAKDIVVLSYSVNSSFPHRDELLKQEMPKHEGKDVRIPYMMCGVLNEKHFLKYVEAPVKSEGTSESTIKLPNGGLAEVTITREMTFEGVTQFESSIRFTGPGSQWSEMTVTTHNGDGLLIRSDTSDTHKPQLYVLQIKKD